MTWPTVGRLRAAVRRRTTQRRATRPGLPDGLPDEVLTAAVVNETGHEPLTVHHQHLSGWKHAGAYRVVISTAAQPFSMIFKDARYTSDHVAAVDGLPVRPGPPEIAVYTHRGAPIHAWIPRVFWCREVERATRYLYVLEDLARTHVAPADRAAAVALCAQLPAVHDDLRGFDDEPQLLRYDDQFSRALLSYAADALEQYESHQRRRHRAELPVTHLLRHWERVSGRYIDQCDIAMADNPLQPIHGDLNLANVLISQETAGFRILDWEWAGMGIAHMDLASTLKGASPDLEARALRAYAHSLTGTEPNANLIRTYRWCKLQRGLLDAGFLARQRLSDAARGRMNLDRYIQASAIRVLEAVDGLEDARNYRTRR